ncbi:unnamed protein product [Caenorhabditis angaria]|uniref:Uncharacterized protein n=1 Tax=Caenorhabditis angaria TaxID=860376 RepID=A0A9P1N3C1_9PELO|nr:unnamed protein product [Caenorhabditis angaria]
MMIRVLGLAVLVNIAYCGHDINPDFMNFLKTHLSAAEVRGIVRDELTTGSFGGGKYNGNVRPVILVHGLNNQAGSLWSIRKTFIENGFPSQRIFATTWGRGVEQMNLNVKLECEYVNRIRKFIQIVRWYTRAEQVDIIGYSMGSPLVRKAILGGKCVDNQAFELGKPITSQIRTFVSVAGANQGSHLCLFPFYDICNPINGLNCVSKFLQDINSKEKYEASYKSYNIASTNDMVVGYWACGKQASSFAGAKEWKVENLNHEQTEYDTGKIQLNLIRQGGPLATRRRRRSHVKKH